MEPGEKADNFLMVILGTGVGGAVVSDGRPRWGRMASPGRSDISSSIPQDRPAAAAAAAASKWLPRAQPSPVATPSRPGRLLPAEAVLDLVIDGDPVATALWSDAVSALAVALAAAVAVLDIHLVIFGGGMAAAGKLLLDPLADELARGWCWRLRRT